MWCGGRCCGSVGGRCDVVGLLVLYLYLIIILEPVQRKYNDCADFYSIFFPSFFVCVCVVSCIYR